MPAGHVAKEATRQRIAGMGTPKVGRVGRQIRVKGKEKMVSKPWAKATARTQGVRQAVREVARKGGTQMVSVDNVIPAENLDTAQDGVRRQAKEEMGEEK